ncbi:MAG: CBS domain-containing protein [Flavobacteriales bacterium]
MITARQLLTTDIPVLGAQDDPINALNLMDEYRVNHLPVVENGKFLGVISETTLMGAETITGNSSHAELQLIKSSVQPGVHILDILKEAGEHHITMIPVVDAENNYLGAVTLEDLVANLSEMQGATQRGGIIVLEMWETDYSLQQIARIVEENDAKILSTSVSAGDNGKIELHLKISIPDLNAIIQSLERFNYEVKASYQEQEYNDDLKKRYEELMRYLSI